MAAAGPDRSDQQAEQQEPVEHESRPTAEEQAPPDPGRVFDRLLVTGGAERVETMPGAADFLGREELQRQRYADVHRILRKVPGINIQEEEGYGLRPNIGMRGTGVERSQKVTLLEDGVLIAPAPYAAPAAYYVPTPARMDAVEVRKGSAAIVQGPFTTGGVINFVSSAIPDEPGGKMEISFGSEETIQLHARTGGSSIRWGWLLETFQLDTDGFKDLDGGGPTGVRLEDYLGKVRFNSTPSASLYQLLEIKLGRTEQFGEDTYLGLAQVDFDRTPLRRYAASQEDWIDTDHEQLQVRYFAQPGARLSVTATLYRNDFFRNWHKLQSVGGVGIGEVLDEPDRYPRELGILRGQADDASGGLMIRNNRRGYRAQGLEGLLDWELRTARAEHRVQVGIRLHEDREDRFQEEDSWSMIEGRMTFHRLGRPGSQSNRIDEAEAAALFVRDSISFGRWALSPGVRFESIDFLRSNYGTDDPSRSGSRLLVEASGVSELMPGMGVAYSPSPAWSVFGGVHKGFAPPGPGQGPETRAEESWNLELGFRYRHAGLGAKAVAFFSDYDNLLGRDSLSVGGEGTGDAFNGGRVEVSGVEAAVEHDFGRSRGWPLGLPASLVYTYSEGQFRSSFESDFPDWAPEVRTGDELPYVATHQLAIGLGLVSDRWKTYLDLAYVGAMRTSPGRGPIPVGEGTDANLVVDVSLSYRWRPGLKLRLQARNLTDEIYIVARRPAGVRPGRPRAVLLGLDWDF